MKQYSITTTILFASLIYNGRFDSNTSAEKTDIWDRIDAMKKNHKGTFSFQCQDQMVKVESKVYHIDRLRWSLKSGYFERLFTFDNFKQNNDSVLEIQMKNSGLFPTIVDLIHGEELINVLNGDNYFPLLQDMYYLEMEIDLHAVRSIIDDLLDSNSFQDEKIFELYNYIKEHSDFEYLSESVFKHFVKNLTMLQNHPTFTSLSLDHLILLIKNVQGPNHEKKYLIVKMCAKWLCHDMKNRLPHMTKLMSCVQSVFFCHPESGERRAEFIQCLPTSNVDEQAVSTCLCALLAGQKLEQKNNYENDDRSSSEKFQGEWDENDDRSSSEKYQGEWDEGNHFVNKRDQRAKLKEFLEKGVCYDITVRVREKLFKLHRVFLELKSNYFRKIFEAEYAEANALHDGIQSCPSKDKEYVLSDEISLSGFDKVLDYIYFDMEIPYRDTKPDIFITADVLRIEEIWKKCKTILIKYPYHIGIQERIELLKFTYGKTKHEDLYFHYVCEFLSWPEIYNVSQFCSVPWTILENNIHFSTVYALNPDNILDMFSKWVYHDAKNRIHLLPPIAQIINPYCQAGSNEFKARSLKESDFSEQFVRDKLYQILSSPSYMARSKKLPKKLEEIPLFIASNAEYPKSKVILNADLDVIASYSYNYSESNSSSDYWVIKLVKRVSQSATLINDSLFTLANFDDPPTFYVYNLFLKKYFPLNVNLEWDTDRFEVDFYTILNCNNEIYGCSLHSRVVKYSMQFNRWITISKDYMDMVSFRHTSDGETLYRMYPRGLLSLQYCVQRYNFGTNSWIEVSESPTIEESFCTIWSQWTVINNRDLAASFKKGIYIASQNSTSEEWRWRIYKIPEVGWRKDNSTFVQCEDRMLLLVDEKLLYHYFLTNESCILKGPMPLEGRQERLPYYNIVTIHRPTQHTVINNSP